MTMLARDIAQKLSTHALAVCQHYLSNGRRVGTYWRVGDAMNTPGQSLFVRLVSAQGRMPGKWTDAATGEHGDLLDLIRINRGYATLAETLAEARHFLHEAPPRPPEETSPSLRQPALAALRLFKAARPIGGTPASVYLSRRGLRIIDDSALRFHPACYLRDGGQRREFPALLTAVRNGDGVFTGLQRTYLAPGGPGKANICDPVRAMGLIHGSGAWFGPTAHVLAAGEGLETILSVQTLMPHISCVAALAAAHLAALPLPAGLRRLYIAVDDDHAGRHAAQVLGERARLAGVLVCQLVPSAKDWNIVLQRDGPARSRDLLAQQMMPIDCVP